MHLSYILESSVIVSATPRAVRCSASPVVMGKLFGESCTFAVVSVSSLLRRRPFGCGTLGLSGYNNVGSD